MVKHPFQLPDAAVEIGKRQVRRSEDPILMGEAPLLFDPTIERMKDIQDGIDVGLHWPLHAHTLRWEHPHRLHALLVHNAQTSLTVEPFRVLLRTFRHQCRIDAVAYSSEIVVERTGTGPRVDIAWSRNPRVEFVSDHVTDSAIDLFHQNATVRKLRAAVTREGVRGLPIVVICVEDGRDRVVKLRHRSAPQSVP
jgi:hypothetical protein